LGRNAARNTQQQQSPTFSKLLFVNHFVFKNEKGSQKDECLQSFMSV